MMGGTTSTTNGMLLADAAAAGIRPSCSGVESVGEAVDAPANTAGSAGTGTGTGGDLLLGRVGGDAEGGDGGMVGDGSGDDAAVFAAAAVFARSKAAIATPITGRGNNLGLGRRAASVLELGNALGPGLGRTGSCLRSSAPVVAGDRHRHRHRHRRHRPRLGDGRRRWPVSGSVTTGTLLGLLTGLGLGLGLGFRLGLGTGCDDGRSTEHRRW